MDRGAWWAAVHGVSRSRTRLSNFTFTFHFPALEKEMATHSSGLAWRIPGTGEPGQLPSMGRRVGHDWSDLAAVCYIKLFLLSFRSLVTKHPETLKKCFVHLPPKQAKMFGNSLILGAHVTYPNWDSFQNESRGGTMKNYTGQEV